MAKKGFDLAALAREQMGAGMAQTVESIREITLDDIDANEANFYAKSNLDDLAANIELVGLIQPVAVKPGEGGRWTLIDGERRYQAVKLLGWKAIRAVVHRPASSVMEELMLISANMQQRKMTGADLSQQAERYTECLADLKRSGVNIPGRLRAAVAEAFGVSESRIAKLAAIRANLIDELLAKFDAGELNESAAYSLSKLDRACQLVFVEHPELCQGWRIEVVALGAKTITAAECPDVGESTCLARRTETVAAAGYVKCHAGCCLGCPQLRLCGGGCAAAKAKAEELNADFERTQAELAAKREGMKANISAGYAAQRAARVKEADEQWTRFKTLREAAGVPLDEAARALGLDADDLQAAEGREDGYIDPDEPLTELAAGGVMDAAALLGTDVYALTGRPNPGGWSWTDGGTEPPDPDVTGTICCWGARGFRTVNAADYAAAREAFPGDYDWWCEPVPPKEFKSNIEEDEDNAVD